MIGSVFLRALTEAGARYGVQSARVHDELGVTEALLADSSASVSLDVATRAWLLVPELSNQADFGLLAAETMPPGSYGDLEYAVLSSPTAKEALARAVRFQRVTYAMSDLSFAASGPQCVVRSRSLGLATDEELRHYIEHGFAFVATRVRALVLPGSMPVRVAFPHARPASTRVHQRIFGDVVHFGQPRAELVYRAEDLERPLASHDPAFLESFSDEEQKLSAAAARAATSTKERAKHVLLAMMRQGDGSMASVARAVGQSTRTLQRNLRAEGIGFSELVDEVRAGEARRYVTEGKLSYGEIAFRLGFSQQSAFFRAFKRWTKTTPSGMRMRARSRVTP
jgi:AraC-like DNA-binding protein